MSDSERTYGPSSMDDGPSVANWKIVKQQKRIEELEREVKRLKELNNDRPTTFVEVETPVVTPVGVPYNQGADVGICGYQVYDIDAYQTLAVKTLSKNPSDFQSRMAVCALGLAGESGEVADLVKKWLGHGHDLNHEKIKDEVGDILWYIAVISHVMGLRLSEISARNVEKLRKRYPDGFSSEKSKNRSE